ncbi:CHASE2 domain-containing protein [bacterium]|nr:CHASE2 domain-containing protein [bacterium]
MLQIALLRKVLNGYSSKQQRKSLLLGAVVGLAVAALCYISSDHDWMRFAENLIQRTWIERYYATNQQGSDEQYLSSSASLIDRTFSEKIVLVVFDDSSLRSGLRWPISRSLYKDLVRKLKLAGAKTIAFDIIFSGPSQDSQADALLKQTFTDSSVIVPYGLIGRDTTISRGLLYPPLIEGWSSYDLYRRLGFTMEVSDPIDKRVRLAVLKVNPPSGIVGAPHYSLTVTALAHYLGISPQEVIDRHADKCETTDLTIAGSPYAFTATVGRIAYCGSDLVSGTEDSDEPAAADDEATALEGHLGRVVRQAPQAKMAKNNIPPISDFLQVWPVQDILETPDEALPGLFGVSSDPSTGKEVPNKVLTIIGVNVPGGYDIKMSDVGSISGVSIHANILWNLLQGTFLKDYSSSAFYFILGMALLATLLATYLETKWASALFLALCGGYWYAGYHLMYSTYFTEGGVLIPVFSPWLGALACFITVILRNVLVERNARQTMHNALADVLPVPDIEDWVNNRGLEIGSEERNLTILFSDIRGYTDLSETLNPVDITEMLNTYHEAMGSIFEHYGGIIFDYQGDAQMVVFGLAPASQPNHAAAAVKAATGMVLRLDQLRAEWKAQKRPVFECGVGVCTGSVALGVVGSKYRKQICAIGDPTNTSARMQGKSKELNCPVLMTESTFTAAGSDIDAHFIQAVRVKGKREPLNVYGPDIETMRQILKQDGLNLDEALTVILVLTLLPQHRSAKAELLQQLQRELAEATAAHSGITISDTASSAPDSLTAVFGWKSNDEQNHALNAYQTALDILKQHSGGADTKDCPFIICLHCGFATVRSDGSADEPKYSIQSEAWNTAIDISHKSQSLRASLLATDAVLPTLGDAVSASAISTYKVPHKQQTIAIYALAQTAQK